MSVVPVADRVAAIKARFDGCFGCGLHNPIGLQLGGFSLEGDSLTCNWEPRPDYRSFPDVVHGGIVAAALDEVMAWTAMLLTDHTVVTGTMELRFRQPALCTDEFRLTGRLVDHRGKRVMLSSSLQSATGTAIASAKAMFLASEPLQLVHSAE